MDFNSWDKEDEFVENCNLYDPRFFLHLFAQICSSENYVDRHLKLIESGVLGLALASLSSRDDLIRAAGATLVSRVYMQVIKIDLALCHVLRKTRRFHLSNPRPLKNTVGI